MVPVPGVKIVPAESEHPIEGSEGAAAVVWQTTRVLYHGQLPMT